MNKNILLITDMNFPYGGASANFIRLLANGLSENNEDISVILQKGHQFGKNKKLTRSGYINSVHYWHCCYKNRPTNYILKIVDDFFGIFLPPFYILFYAIFKKLESVIMYTSSAQFSMFNVLICKILNIKIYNVVPEYYDRSSFENENLIKKIKGFSFKFQINHINTKFNGLIVLSYFLRDYYLKKNVSKSRILIQPNLVNISNFEISENLLNQSDIIRIGYCGTPTNKDGVNDLLIAFKKVHDKYINTELLIIGDSQSNNSLLPKLIEFSETIGINEHVVFTGLVDSSEIPNLLNSCKILVLARPNGVFAEAGFPTKLGEYMACKIPVVITKVGDIPFYLNDGENAMLAEPDNPQSVADKIGFLIDHPDKARVIGENGYNWALDKLQYNKAAKKIIDFIENVK
jgi:glycosyltransferase involved in cell wall biosynthesis